jgi:phosphate:Na+ symporter
MISSIGANKNGKRTAVAHLYFNVIGVAFWLGMYYFVGAILRATGVVDVFAIADGATVNMWGIAGIHTVFKILAVLLFTPFTKLLEKLACATVKGTDKKGDEYTDMLDERLLETPSVAIDRSKKVACHMAELSIRSFQKSLRMLDAYDPKVADEVRDEEGKADVYEDELGSYLVKLSSKNMDEQDSLESTKLLHMIGDLERISDHAVNILESAEEIRDKNVAFSQYAISELNVMKNAVDEILSITLDAFLTGDLERARSVEPLEQVIDDLRDQIKLRHTIRLQKNLCSIELGFILSDVLTNLERVADHCSNIAGCLIEISQNEALDLHNYLKRVHKGGEVYDREHQQYEAKYALPVGMGQGND